MSVATRAFRNLLEQYSNSQAVVHFCQGLADKEAGHHVCIHEQKSIKEALNGVKWYQYVHQSMYGDNRKDSQKPEYEDPVGVYSSLNGQTGEWLRLPALLPSWQTFKMRLDLVLLVILVTLNSLKGSLSQFAAFLSPLIRLPVVMKETKSDCHAN